MRDRDNQVQGRGRKGVPVTGKDRISRKGRSVSHVLREKRITRNKGV